MARIRNLACGLFLPAGLSCGPRTPPPSVAQPEIATSVSVPTTETFSIGGESDPRYTLVIQRAEPGNTGIEQDYQAKGDAVVRDWNRFTWGKGNVVVIDGGMLTVNGVDHGQLTRGSRVVVSPSDQVAISLAKVGPMDDILRQHIYLGSKKVSGDSSPSASSGDWVTPHDPRSVLKWYGEKMQVVTSVAQVREGDYDVNSVFGSTAEAWGVEVTVTGDPKQRQTRMRVVVRAHPNQGK